MTPRRASLRVAHQAACPNATKTALESAGRGSGCRCQPSYYTFHRDRDGRPSKGPRVRDRQTAERDLRKLQVEIDEGRLGLRRVSEKTFAEWAAEYLEIIGSHGRKDSTVRAYGPTIRYCTEAFGSTPIAEVGNPELRRLVEAVRENGGSDATVSKHLRHVGAIFTAAVDDGLIETNPVPRFKKSLRLRVLGGVPPFTDDELAKLWAKMQALEVEPAYVMACKLAVTTGARIGELAALNLDDVDLLTGRIEIRHHYDRATGTLTLPKDNEARTVFLVPAARALLERWIAEHGRRPADAPLLVAPRSGGRINTQYLAKVVKNAMTKASIPTVGESGRARKPLHSFRASFDRICREQGRDPQWVQEVLGHSDPRLTLQVYGKWSEAGMHAEAEKAEAASFPV
jgi:integrase